MSTWRTTTIGEYIPFTYGKGLPQAKRNKGVVHVYGSNGCVDYHNEAHVKTSGIIIGRKGSVGALHLSPKPFWPIDTSFYIEKDDLEELSFDYYLLKSLGLNKMNSDSAVPGLNRSNAHAIQIKIPEKEEDRKALGRWISKLDNKIAINQQINQTLEEMAQAVFKSWFVDFEPVRAKMAVLESGGSEQDATLAAMQAISGKSAEELVRLKSTDAESYNQLQTTANLFPSAMIDSELGDIPEGWEVSPLGKYLTIKRGGSPRPIKDFIVPEGFPWLKIADATAEKSPFIYKTKEFIKEEGLKKTTYLKKGSLILSNSATPGIPKFLEINSCIHDGWLHFPEIKNLTPEFLFLLFKKIRIELIAQGNGSVFTNLKTDILRSYVTVIPSNELITIFTIHIQKILETVNANCKQSQTLTQIRDTLLPKLLSGEIDVGGIANE